MASTGAASTSNMCLPTWLTGCSESLLHFLAATRLAVGIRNYIDPPERKWLPGYAATLYAVSTLMIAIRIWLRATKQAGSFGVDDALLIFSGVVSTMFTIIAIITSVAYHLGRHIWDLPFTDLESIPLMTWLAELAFLICGGSTKLSVLLFYRRLAKGTYSPLWKWANISAIVFTAMWTLAFIMALCFNCRPLNAYWLAFNPLYTHAYTCVNTTVINLLSGIFAVLSDLYAVVLPLAMVRHLAVHTSQRIAMNVLFSLGILVVGASSVRTYYLYEVGKKSDISVYIFNVFTWAQLELQLGIMCASAPALRVFFRRFFHSHAFSTWRDKHSGSHSLNSRPRRNDDDEKKLTTIDLDFIVPTPPEAAKIRRNQDDGIATKDGCDSAASEDMEFGTDGVGILKGGRFNATPSLPRPNAQANDPRRSNRKNKGGVDDEEKMKKGAISQQVHRLRKNSDGGVAFSTDSASSDEHDSGEAASPTSQTRSERRLLIAPWEGMASMGTTTRVRAQAYPMQRIPSVRIADTDSIHGNQLGVGRNDSRLRKYGRPTEGYRWDGT